MPQDMEIDGWQNIGLSACFIQGPLLMRWPPSLIIGAQKNPIGSKAAPGPLLKYLLPLIGEFLPRTLGEGIEVQTVSRRALGASKSMGSTVLTELRGPMALLVLLSQGDGGGLW
jgi:hypothetical protein